jgi:hypothetical protein
LKGTVFSNILRDASISGIDPKNIVDASTWLRSRAAEEKTTDPSRLIKLNSDRGRTAVLTGQMYLFNYDAKHKDTLPYYDRYPLIFPFKKVKDGFLGLNLHYLPYPYRAILMDNLYPLLNNDKMNETTRLRISYSILDRTSKLKYFAPCVKHYLNKHIKSRFIYISPDEWNIALFLPLQRFNTNVTNVYRDSKNIIKRR